MFGVSIVALFLRVYNWILELFRQHGIFFPIISVSIGTRNVSLIPSRREVISI